MFYALSLFDQSLAEYVTQKISIRFIHNVLEINKKDNKSPNYIPFINLILTDI